MANTKDPGIAATVYFVHRSETKAAFPKTVSNTIRYSVVPQNQWPESRPSDCLRSPQNRMTENPKVTRLWYNALNIQSQKAVFVKNAFS